jgi:hypothetical protein
LPCFPRSRPGQEVLPYGTVLRIKWIVDLEISALKAPHEHVLSTLVPKGCGEPAVCRESDCRAASVLAGECGHRSVTSAQVVEQPPVRMSLDVAEEALEFETKIFAGNASAVAKLSNAFRKGPSICRIFGAGSGSRPPRYVRIRKKPYRIAIWPGPSISISIGMLTGGDTSGGCRRCLSSPMMQRVRSILETAIFASAAEATAAKRRNRSRPNGLGSRATAMSGFALPRSPA